MTACEPRASRWISLFLTTAAYAWHIAAPPPLPASEAEAIPACGVAALYAAMRTLGRDVGVANIQEQFQQQLGRDDLTTVSLAEISQTAESYGLYTAALRIEPERLNSISLPAILYLRRRSGADAKPSVGHFIVVRAARAQHAEAIDLTASQGWQWVPIATLQQFWHGDVLAVSTKPIAAPSPWLRQAAVFLWLLAGFAIAILLWRPLFTRFGKERSDASNVIQASP